MRSGLRILRARLAAAMAAAAAVACAGCATERPGMVDKSFPAEVCGWHADGAVRTYVADTIFGYMNGAGEIYLAYGFRRVLVRDYTRGGRPKIVAELYEMSHSRDAHGLFTHDPEGEDVGVGQDSAYAAGLLRAWKGPYFLRILAERDLPEAKAAIVALGRALTAGLPTGDRASLIDRLPTEHLDAASIRYFHTLVSLNSFYYLADANMLGLSPQTDAVLADYRRDGGKTTLLLVQYPDSGGARRAHQAFDRVYLENADTPGSDLRVEKTEDGRYVGALCRDCYVIVALAAPSRAACRSLLERAARDL